jgi:hypothetical protein
MTREAERCNAVDVPLCTKHIRQYVDLTQMIQQRHVDPAISVGPCRKMPDEILGAAENAMQLAL